MNRKVLIILMCLLLLTGCKTKNSAVNNVNNNVTNNEIEKSENTSEITEDEMYLQSDFQIEEVEISNSNDMDTASISDDSINDINISENNKN